VVFVVDDKEFHLHKTILAARSPVFATLFQSDFVEVRQNKVVLKDENISAEHFEQFLAFIYSGKVPTLGENALELFYMADKVSEWKPLRKYLILFVFIKYQIELLKSICEKDLGNNLTVESVIDVLLLADMHIVPKLKQKCIVFIAQNLKTVKTRKKFKQIEARPDLLMQLMRISD